MCGGEKCNRNRSEKLTARFSVICSYMSCYDPSAFNCFAIWCVPKNSMSPSNSEREHARDSTASMAVFLNHNKIFHNQYANVKKMKPLSNAALIVCSFINTV